MSNALINVFLTKSLVNADVIIGTKYMVILAALMSRSPNMGRLSHKNEKFSDNAGC